MVRYSFSNDNGTQILRQVHADKVFALTGDPREGRVQGEALRDACIAVRDTYRCRDVRKKLRRVAMICDEREVFVNIL